MHVELLSFLGSFFFAVSFPPPLPFFLPLDTYSFLFAAALSNASSTSSSSSLLLLLLLSMSVTYRFDCQEAIDKKRAAAWARKRIEGIKKASRSCFFLVIRHQKRQSCLPVRMWMSSPEMSFSSCLLINSAAVSECKSEETIAVVLVSVSTAHTHTHTLPTSDSRRNALITLSIRAASEEKEKEALASANVSVCVRFHFSFRVCPFIYSPSTEHSHRPFMSKGDALGDANENSGRRWRPPPLPLATTANFATVKRNRHLHSFVRRLKGKRGLVCPCMSDVGDWSAKRP